MQIIKLEAAFKWKCPTCGRSNYVDAMDLPEGEFEDIPIETPEWSDGEGRAAWCCAPDKVQCGTCKGFFVTDDEEA